MNIDYIQKLSLSLQEKIRNRPTLTFLKNHSIESLRKFNSLSSVKKGRDINIPNVFDGTVIWKNVLSPIRNQKNCGSCWAFASSSTLADRFNIQSGGKLKIELSPAYMLLCDFLGKDFSIKHPEIDIKDVSEINEGSILQGGCSGNSLYDSWRYLTIIGTAEDNCVPYNKVLSSFGFKKLSDYKENDNEKLPLCEEVTGALSDMCSDITKNLYTGEEYGTPIRFFRSFKFYSIENNEEDIKHNIYSWGPVTTGMQVYEDFYEFDSKNDVYEWNGKGEMIGGHAIQILGWGEGTFGGVFKKYWIIRNSWGHDWGRSGYFYMIRGINNCKIEENVITGIPDFFYPVNYNLPEIGFSMSETDDIKNQRILINTDVTMSAGGINPEIGYTRRVITSKPWLDLKPIINYKELPNWNTFVAGEYFQNERKNKYFWFIGIGFFILFCLIFIFMFRKRRS